MCLTLLFLVHTCSLWVFLLIISKKKWTPSSHLRLVETHWITSPADGCIKAHLSPSKQCAGGPRFPWPHLGLCKESSKPGGGRNAAAVTWQAPTRPFGGNPPERSRLAAVFKNPIWTSPHFTAACWDSRSDVSDRFVDPSAPRFEPRSLDDGGGNGRSAWEPHSRRMTAP